MDPLVDHSRYHIKYVPSDQGFLQNLNQVKGVPLKVDLAPFRDLGFQGSRLYEAYMLLKKGIEEGCTVVLCFPSNVISCGLREIVVELCKRKLVNVIVTTGGGIEQDLIKVRTPFRHSFMKISDQKLHQIGVNRTQNLYIPNSGYIWFEKVLLNCLKEKELLNSTPVELVKALTKSVADQSSYLYWCFKNDILVLPVGLEDGCIGDVYAAYNYNKSINNQQAATLNSVDTLNRYLDYNFKDPTKKILVLALGGNMPKHYAMNGLIPIGGADYAIYLNNEPTLFGSNESAPPEQAISWGKLKPNSSFIKVQGDFIFTFYLLGSAILGLS